MKDDTLLIIDTIKSMIEREIDNPIKFDKNLIIVFPNDGTKVKITTKNVA